MSTLRAWLSLCMSLLITSCLFAQNAPKPGEPDPAKTPAMKADVDAVAKDVADVNSTGIHKYADVTWVLVSTGLVMFMMPGLALFYGGMARRKNVLGTMMHTMIALGLVGVQWVCFGYSLSFGTSAKTFEMESMGISKGSLIGYSPELLFLGSDAAVGSTQDDELKAMKIDPAKATDEQKKTAKDKADEKSKFKTFPNTNIPLYLHAMFQGMFAIITVALISGAFAERVKFGAYCLFALLWTTIVYDPLAHWVWSFDWVKAKPDDATFPAAGILGANGAIDFAGGTVVHIAAGFSGLAAVLLLRKRIGYGKQAFHPNSMVLTLLGAGLLWFGWFGFNGGSALFANGQAVSALTVTQVAAAMAGLTWTAVEWIHKGKPTALGFASGLVAGLVAITPASGYVTPGGALVIGLVAGSFCYGTVLLKGVLGYDDSLDAFGIHGVGGFLGAILTGLLVNLSLWSFGAELKPEQFPGKLNAAKDAIDLVAQVKWQLIASIASAVYAFVVTSVLVLLIDKTIGFTLSAKDEADGLDRACHGEIGFDFGGGALDELTATPEPKAAVAPPNGKTKRFTVVIKGVDHAKLVSAWSGLCQASDKPHSPNFKKVYPFLTTVTENSFRFRGGDTVEISTALKKLIEETIPGSAVTAHVES
ncbi:MAG: ammonium transporter [Gemmataceae bacterium]